MFLFILLLSLYNVEYFKVVNLSLDESGQSVFFFNDDDQEGDDIS